MLFGRERNLRRSLRSNLDNFFRAYERGDFPSDEELTEWDLDDR